MATNRSLRTDTGEPDVFLIAANPQVVPLLLRCAGLRVRCFSSVEDFDAWRAGEARAEGIAPFVDKVLGALQVNVDALPVDVQLALQWLRAQPHAPALKVFAEAVCSRRSFFRRWPGAIPERPRFFLDRVQALHAASLLAHGATFNDVVHQVGCRSGSALRRLLGERH